MNSSSKKHLTKYISFSRLLLVIFLVLLIILYVSVYIVVNGEIKRNASRDAEHLYSRVNAIIDESQMVYDSLTAQEEITEIFKGASADPEKLLNLCRLMKLSTDTSPYINHIYLFKLDDGKIFSDQGAFASSSASYILSTFGASVESLSDISDEGSFHLYNNMMYTPYCVYPVYDGDSQKGALAICLDMTKFLRIFYDIDAAACAIYTDNASISSIAHGVTTDFNWEDVRAVSRLTGSQVYCYYLHDDALTYMIAKEKSVYNRPLTMIAIVFGIYALVMFASGLISFLKNRRRVRARYAVLAELLPDTFAGDSSFGLMYDKIQSSIRDYSVQRTQVANSNKEKALLKVLSDSAAQADSLDDAGVPKDMPDYYIAAFSARLAESDADTIPDREFPAFIQRATVTELAAQNNVSAAVCETDFAFVALFYGITGDDGKEKIIQLCNDAVDIINSNYQIPSRVIISDTISSTKEIADVWQSQSELQRFIYSVNSRAACIRMDNISRHADLLEGSDYIRQEQILINTILARKYEIIPDLTSSILSSYVLLSGDSYKAAQQRFISVRNILAEGARSSAGADASEHAEKLYACESIDELSSLTRDVYTALAEAGRQADTPGGDVTIIQSYIDQNLSDPNLSVSMVSEAVDINMSRLIRLFQSETGMSVADYISFQRIQMAKKLLRETDMTVAQIADKIGYNNADTFTRNFRKQRNMTPTEYRKFYEKQEAKK